MNAFMHACMDAVAIVWCWAKKDKKQWNF